MKTLLCAATILATTTCITAPAIAADLDVYQDPVYTEVEYGSGWYLRGDIGYATGINSDVTFYSDQRYSFDNQNWDEMWSIGGGIGYTFNDVFRTDLTLDYYNDLGWNASSYGSSCYGMNNSGCTSQDTASGKMYTYLANGYIQLGEAYGFSPYLTGGIGTSYVNWEALDSMATCSTDAIGEMCPGGINTTGGNQKFTYLTDYEGHSDWRFAYSLGAGFQYRLDKNWLLDFGYRYTNIDDGVLSADSQLNDNVQFSDLHMNEFRAGLRYEIW